MPALAPVEGRATASRRGKGGTSQGLGRRGPGGRRGRGRDGAREQGKEERRSAGLVRGPEERSLHYLIVGHGGRGGRGRDARSNGSMVGRGRRGWEEVGGQGGRGGEERACDGSLQGRPPFSPSCRRRAPAPSSRRAPQHQRRPRSRRTGRRGGALGGRLTARCKICRRSTPGSSGRLEDANYSASAGYEINLKYHPTRVLTLVYQPFAFGLTCIFAYYEAKLNTRRRNLAGYALYFLSSFALIMLDIGTKGHGGIPPYIGICIISAFFGTSDALVLGGMVGDISLMCPEFIQSYSAGLAASGVLTSALRLVTKAAFEDSQDGLRNGAMLFFSVACLFELLCFLLYAYVFPKLPIVKYYRSKAASEGSKNVASDLAAAGVKTDQDKQVEEDPQKHERLSTKQMLMQNIDYAVDIYLIYVLTLSIFPGFLSEDTGAHSLGTCEQEGGTHGADEAQKKICSICSSFSLRRNT